MKRDISKLLVFVLALVLLVPTLVGAATAPKELNNVLVVGDKAFTIDFLNSTNEQSKFIVEKAINEELNGARKIYFVSSPTFAEYVLEPNKGKVVDQTNEEVTLYYADGQTAKYKAGKLVEEEQKPQVQRAKAGPKLTLTWLQNFGLIIPQESARDAIGNAAELEAQYPNIEFRWFEAPRVGRGVQDDIDAKVFVKFGPNDHEIVDVKVDTRQEGSFYKDIEDPKAVSHFPGVIKSDQFDSAGDYATRVASMEALELLQETAYIDPEDLVDKGSFKNERRVAEYTWAKGYPGVPDVSAAGSKGFKVEVVYKDGSSDFVEGTIHVYDTGKELADANKADMFKNVNRPDVTGHNVGTNHMYHTKGLDLKDFINSDYHKFVDLRTSKFRTVQDLNYEPTNNTIPAMNINTLTARNTVNGYPYTVVMDLLFVDDGENDGDPFTATAGSAGRYESKLIVAPTIAAAFEEADIKDEYMLSDIFRLASRNYSTSDKVSATNTHDPQANLNDIWSKDNELKDQSYVYTPFFDQTVDDLPREEIKLAVANRPTPDKQSAKVSFVWGDGSDTDVTVPVKVIRDMAEYAVPKENPEILKIKRTATTTDINKAVMKAIDAQDLIDQFIELDIFGIDASGKYNFWLTPANEAELPVFQKLAGSGVGDARTIKVQWHDDHRPDLTNTKAGDFITAKVVVIYPDGSAETVDINDILVE